MATYNLPQILALDPRKILFYTISGHATLFKRNATMFSGFNTKEVL